MAPERKLMSLREVAKALKVSEQRVYQLDDVLRPTVIARGKKMKTRWYHPELVDRVRYERTTKLDRPPAPPRTARDLDATAAVIAARVLRGYADSAPFFGGVGPEDTEPVRARLRKIAERVSR